MTQILRLGCPTKLTRIKRTETKTETSFDTIQNKEASFGCFAKNETASFGVLAEQILKTLDAK
jgi:hypothetical protein